MLTRGARSSLRNLSCELGDVADCAVFGGQAVEAGEFVAVAERYCQPCSTGLSMIVSAFMVWRP